MICWGCYNNCFWLDESKVESEFDKDMEEVSKWFIHKKLFLNWGKTEAILIGSVTKLNFVSKLEE